MKKQWLAGAALVCAVAAGGAWSQDLPRYKPAQQLTGEIRLWGSPSMLRLMRLWEDGFRQYEPNIVFQNDLKSTATAQFGLFESVADLAVSARHLYPYEYYGVYRRSLLYPVEVTVATGATQAVGKSTALAIVVNKANPIEHVSLAQLDGIFGTARTGGWQDLVWADSAARGPEKNLRTWGQMGLTDKWAGRPIHPYGPPGIYPGGQTFFQRTVMGGGDMFAETLREYQDRRAMLQALASDPDGIAYVALGNATPELRAKLKVIPVGATDAGPFVPLTRATVTDHSYPLARYAYLYFAPDGPGGVAKPIDPKLREFLTYVLSREGQAQAAKEGDYLPLTAETAKAQMSKLK
jgi:phosphate transport system substrate-binding protein